MENFCQHTGRTLGAHQASAKFLQRAKGALCGFLAATLLTGWMLVAPGFLAAQTANREPKNAAPAGDVENGRKIFASHPCSTCHGSDGQGASGPRIAPPPLELSAFVHYVRQPVGLMPAFNNEAISDAQLADVFVFLKSAAPPEAASETTPAGNAENGKKLFSENGCYECHGYQGQGAQQTGAATIGPPPLPFAAFAKYVHQPTGSMPPYAEKVLSDAQLADIYAYLKSIPTPPSPKSIPLLNQ